VQKLPRSRLQIDVKLLILTGKLRSKYNNPDGIEY